MHELEHDLWPDLSQYDAQTTTSSFQSNSTKVNVPNCAYHDTPLETRGFHDPVSKLPYATIIPMPSANSNRIHKNTRYSAQLGIFNFLINSTPKIDLLNTWARPLFYMANR